MQNVLGNTPLPVADENLLDVHEEQHFEDDQPLLPEENELPYRRVVDTILHDG